MKNLKKKEPKKADRIKKKLIIWHEDFKLHNSNYLWGD